MLSALNATKREELTISLGAEAVGRAIMVHRNFFFRLKMICLEFSEAKG